MKTPTVLTVTQLTTFLKAVIEGTPQLSSVYLNGEISNFTNHVRSGHYYFSLKDENSLIRAVMFRSANQHLRFLPQDGMKVLVRGRVSVYERDGNYQLYVEDMQPDGAGALAIAYEQLKNKLAAEGLFDVSRHRPIPRYPERVGVITSPTGAAVRDILNILGRRYPLAQVVLAPVLVQGMGAPAQIIDAIGRFNRAHAADVLIVGRGGGSAEELWAFNDEKLVRAVAASEIPVISAVGHETDFTLCDFAADLRAPTPSAAAELAVPDRMELQTALEAYRVRLRGAVSQQVQTQRALFRKWQTRNCFASPEHLTDGMRQRLDMLSNRLMQAQKHRVVQERTRWQAMGQRLQSLSPLAVLLRGYAVAEQNGETLEKIEQVQLGAPMSVRLQNGTVHCTADAVESENQLPKG